MKTTIKCIVLYIGYMEIVGVRGLAQAATMEVRQDQPPNEL